MMRTPLWIAVGAGLIAGAATAETAETPEVSGTPAGTGAADAPAAAALRVTGSSTVAPFALVAAGMREDGGALFVEATGTAAGMRALCGAERAPLAGASRPIRPAEIAACAAGGVTTVVEVELGIGAIVVAQSSNAPPLPLTLGDLYRATAALVPSEDGCDLVPNRAKHWSDIRPELGDRPIRIYGPPVTSGTRDVFLEKVVAAGARSAPCLAALESEDPARFARALALRLDGSWIDAGESDGATAYALTRLPEAVGILGRVHAVAQDGLDLLPIGGVAPDDEAVGDGRYPLARPLYLYTTAGALTGDARIKPLVTVFSSPDPGGRLAGMGLAARGGAGARLIATSDGTATPLALGR